jgi:steroid delta-isomerase-like uncharacterized protein
MTENEQAVRKLFAGVNARDLDLLNEFFSADYVNHDAFPGQTQGAVGAHIAVQRFLEGLPDLAFTVEDVVAAGDRIAVRLTVQGTHKGEFRGVPATGKHVSIGALELFRMSEGQAVEGWMGWDMLGLMEQVQGVRLIDSMKAETEVWIQALAELMGAVGRRIEGLNERQMNWRPSMPDANSLYAIATHLMGNSAAWVLGIICGQDVTRDRDAEFRATGGSAEEVANRAKQLSAEFARALRSLPTSALDEVRTPRPPLLGVGQADPLTVREGLLRVLLHGRLHIGHMELTRDLAKAMS